MRVTKFEQLSTEETLARFKQTRLRGYGQPLVYENAELSLIQNVDIIKTLVPAQRYILRSNVHCILNLADQFERMGVDIFALTGAVLFWYRNDDGEMVGPVPLCPPIVEADCGLTDGFLINDGMHRITAARYRNRSINVIGVTNVPAEYPYYALPLEHGWDEVQVLEEIPDDYVKKAYRDPVNYKALFRDFNGVFPGIQEQRKVTIVA